MKKNLLSILSAITISASVAVAQPTLTASGINPVIGDTYVFKYGTDVAPGNSGTGQNWTLMPATTDTTITYNSSAPSTTPYAASFTQANFCYHAGANYYYFNSSPTSLKKQGTKVGTLSSYSDPDEILHFPFNMGDTYSDAFLVNFTSSGFAMTKTGTTTVTYDGSGTLTLASGVYNNVARVHLVQTYTVTYSGGTSNYNNDQYMWYSNGNHQPIAVTYTTVNSVSAASTQQGSIILSNVATSVYEHENVFSAISAFPNPAGNEVSFNFNGIAMSSVEIFDITGQQVYSQSLSKDNLENYLKINTTEFKDGIYFATFTAADGQTGSKKFSILK